jgi:DNA modification methylase
MSPEDGYDPADNAEKCYSVAISTMRDKLASFRREVIGDCTLYLGDCREILPLLPKADACVTDPPYGIGQDKGFEGFGGFGPPIARRQYDDDWDDVRPPADLIALVLKSAKVSVVFGGNYFTDLLPVGGHWLVWDKKNTMPTFSDCELAWTNIPRKSVKLLTFEYNGLIGKREARVHPTQKPYEVMRWCIERLPAGSDHIIDPFLGSGTTGVAAARIGKRFVGIEREPKYFSIACRRIEEAYKQPDFFVPRSSVPQPMQLAMLEAS